MADNTKKTKKQLLDEAAEVFRSALPEGVTLGADGEAEVRAQYDARAATLAKSSRIRERERGPIEEKIRFCGRCAAALAKADDVTELSALYVRAGIEAGQTIRPTNLCD